MSSPKREMAAQTQISSSARSDAADTQSGATGLSNMIPFSIALWIKNVFEGLITN